MEYNFLTNIESCHVDVPPLLYYSHIPAAIIAVIFGIFILLKSTENRLASKIFFFISMIFSSWVIIEGTIWLLYNSGTMMFLWSFLGILYAALHILSIYFVYVFIDKKDISTKNKAIFVILLLPIALLTASKYNITGFDIENCQAIEGHYFNVYRYFVGSISIIWLIILTVTRCWKANKDLKKQIILIGSGVLAFLFLFSWSEIIGSVTENFNITQYGLFGMPILLGFLAYLIVQYRTFNIKLIATQALVWCLAILIGSQFFFIKIPMNFILNGFTFIASIVFGYFLIKAVKIEIQQKEELEGLTIDLQDTIKQRESLMHLINHKVKGAFTRSKYIFSGMIEGTFGPINDDVMLRARQGLESDDAGIKTIDLILNAANMQKGTVRYEMHPTNLKDLILKSISNKKVQIEARDLTITTDIKEYPSYDINADTFWLKEAIGNLIENSIKYTKHGTITISLEKVDKNFLMTIKDTGVGITEEDKQILFTEGGRGKDSVHVNVDSTGYGLYSVKLITEAHKGRVWGESEGQDKGSTFYLELPAIN